MQKRGVHSPDRADALVMAWWVGRYMVYRDEAQAEARREERRERYLPAPKWRRGVIL